MRDLIRLNDLSDSEQMELAEHDAVQVDGRVYAPYGTDAANVAWVIAVDVSWYRPRDEQPAEVFHPILNPSKILAIDEGEDYMHLAGGEIEIEANDD